MASLVYGRTPEVRAKKMRELEALKEAQASSAPKPRNKMVLTEEEYVLVAQDLMAKAPFSGFLRFHLPLRFAARCEEVRWEWKDPVSGRLVRKELIGGGRNSDLEYD